MRGNSGLTGVTGILERMDKAQDTEAPARPGHALRRVRAKRATALAFKLRDTFIEPQDGAVELARGEEMPAKLIASPDVPPAWVNRALRVLMEVFDLDRVTLLRDGTLRPSRLGYRANGAGPWLALGLLVDGILRLPGGRSIIEKVRNPPQYDSAVFEVEVGMALARSFAEHLVVEPKVSGGSADFGLRVGGREVLLECKSTQEIDLREHRAFRSRTHALLARMHDIKRLPWRIDLEISKPLRDLPSHAADLRKRIDEHHARRVPPTSFQVGPDVRVTLSEHGSMPQSTMMPRWYEYWRADGWHLAFEPSYRDIPAPSIPFQVLDDGDPRPEPRGPDVCVFGYVYRGALGRKYSDLISDALQQTAGRHTIIALQCTHPDIALDAALRKMRAAHPKLMGVWVNPLRREQRVACRDRDRPVLLDLVRSAHLGDAVRFGDRP